MFPPLANSLLQSPKTFHQVSRPFLNYVFNRVSDKRRKEVGPDRTCAEWLMKNGAFIRWVGNPEFVSHYNLLPLDKKIEGNFYIEEVKANSKASIMYYGFRNFEGCNHISKVTFDDVNTIDDRAMNKLSYLQHTLKYLYIGNCKNVTAEGLIPLTKLQNLKLLHLKNLDIKDYSLLDDKLPSDCKITIE